MNMGAAFDEEKVKRLEQIKRYKKEKNLASYVPAKIPKASPPKKIAMSSVGGGYGSQKLLGKQATDLN